MDGQQHRGNSPDTLPVENSESMPAIHRVLTVHADISVPVQLALLDAIEVTLHDRGVSRIWIDPGTRPDLVVLAEFEDD